MFFSAAADIEMRKWLRGCTQPRTTACAEVYKPSRDLAYRILAVCYPLQWLDQQKEASSYGWLGRQFSRSRQKVR